MNTESAAVEVEADAASVTTQPTNNGDIFMIPLKDIRENPLNHRKHYDRDALKELAASIKENGVLQPVMVRTSPDGWKKKEPTFELVFGHRRYRAAQLAELDVIPAQVRQLDDRQVLELAIIENCRRQDIKPMEEAQAYQDLVEKHGLKVEEIATRIGKSKETVYARMKLTALRSKAAQKALDEGEISPSVALLIARIPIAKLQDACAARVLEGTYDPDSPTGRSPLSARAALELVTNEYMVRLVDAPFDPEDEKLTKAGPCSVCPKRTGNCQPGLYPETKDKNICTDPVCFNDKKKVAYALEKERLAEKGKEFLGEKPSLFDDHGRLTYTAAQKYVELKDQCPTDPKKRTYKELIGEGPQPVIVAIDKAGKEHNLMLKADLPDAIRAAGHKVKVETPVDRDEKYKADQEATAFRQLVASKALVALVEAEESRQVTMIEYLQELATEMLFREPHVQQRRGWDDKQVKKEIADANAGELRGMIFEAIHTRNLLTTWNGYSPELENFCEANGIKLKQLEKAEKEAQEKAAQVIAEKAVEEKAAKGKKTKATPKAEKKSKSKKAKAA